MLSFYEIKKARQSVVNLAFLPIGHFDVKMIVIMVLFSTRDAKSVQKYVKKSFKRSVQKICQKILSKNLIKCLLKKLSN